MNIYNKKILSLCGGGIRCTVHIGILQALLDKKIIDQFHTFATSSASSVIIFLYLLTYSPKEIFDLFTNIKIEKLFNFKLLHFIKEYGMSGHDKLEYILGKIIRNKGFSENITFLELYQITGKTFHISTTILQKQSTVLLSHINHPNLKLIEAIKMSTCYPLVMKPIVYESEQYIDGSLLEPFPFKAFSDNLGELLAINIVNEYSQDTQNLEAYITKIFNLWNLGIHKLFILFDQKTIDDFYVSLVIDGDIHPFKSNLTKEVKDKLFKVGYNKIISYTKDI